MTHVKNLKLVTEPQCRHTIPKGKNSVSMNFSEGVQIIRIPPYKEYHIGNDTEQLQTIVQADELLDEHEIFPDFLRIQQELMYCSPRISPSKLR